ncbi:GAF domain-containing sensor histidine kinase [Microbulbifer sp. S227A]|uniref:GAF domain-containing sensor histidine kinase n=1 Tax=Microbulbifer sp. S227A TaxID=3415131 RepID=UPI003C7BDEB4
MVTETSNSWLLGRLRAISRAIAGPLEHDLVLRSFVDEMQKLLPHDHLDIVLLHGAGMQVCYEAGISTSWTDSGKSLRPTATSPIRDLLLGRVDWIVSGDAQTDKRFLFLGADNGPIFDANLRSRIIVPLTIQGQIIGSLAVSRCTVGAYDETMLDRVRAVADLLAPYLFAIEEGRRARVAAVAEAEAIGREEALRIGAQRLTEGMEHERQRLGMDIHDQTLADLARIVRRLSRARRQRPGDTHELMLIENELGAALNDLRGIVEDMRPGILQLFGFTEAVEAHLDRSCSNANALLSKHVIDDTAGAVDRLPDTMRTTLFRIVQEAVTNAVRHADAATITVRVSETEGRLCVVVDDDGAGIPEAAHTSSGGLSNIRTRSRLISASESIHARPGGGTRVEIRLPGLPERNVATETPIS